MLDESSEAEIRQVAAEIERERLWLAMPEAEALEALAVAAFELTDAIDQWTTRASESWIASNVVPVSQQTVRALIAGIRAISAVVVTDLN